jgi:hypothetical protein
LRDTSPAGSLGSSSAITGAIKTLEQLHVVQRCRAAGERMDRVRIDLTPPQAFGFDVTEYVEQGDLAREGLQVLKGASLDRRSVLLHWAAFADAGNNSRCLGAGPPRSGLLPVNDSQPALEKRRRTDLQLTMALVIDVGPHDDGLFVG